MELVVLKATLVDHAVAHDHSSLESHVVVPKAVETRAIGPDHLTLTFPLAVSPVAFVLGFLELDTHLRARNGVHVVHFTVALRSAVFESAKELVSVFEGDAASVLKSSIDESTSVLSSLFTGQDSLLYLEVVVIRILDRDVSISSIVDKLSLVVLAIGEVHLGELRLTPIGCPLSIIQVAVLVEALTLLPVPSMVLVRTLVVTAVGKQHLHAMPVANGSCFEPTLDDLVSSTVKDT